MTIKNLSQSKCILRHAINLILELERQGEVSMNDTFPTIDGLDNILELLNRKDNHGR
ncbi:MAG: hypothetical protein VW166_05355 [Gammaproteobacteria bacterium]